MVIGFFSVRNGASPGNGQGFEKKTALPNFREVKCLQGYSKIGSWILKPARLAVKTV